jgi:hypothetical protein
LTIALTAGALLGTPKTNVLVGLDIRYTPSLFPVGDGANQRSGAFRIGATAAFYIPFFDFN